MNTRQRIFPILLAMLLLCLPLVSFAEETDTQTVPISNTPIKGQILLEKTGLQKTSTYLVLYALSDFLIMIFSPD